MSNLDGQHESDGVRFEHAVLYQFVVFQVLEGMEGVLGFRVEMENSQENLLSHFLRVPL